MAKKLSLLLTVAMLALVCALQGCARGEEALLPSPTGTRWNGTVLEWEYVENADYYLVEWTNGRKEVKENYIDLSTLEASERQEVAVIAVSEKNGLKYSDATVISYSKENDVGVIPTKNLEYTLLEDASGWSVTKGTANISGTVVIPDFYNGLPVKEIGADAFSYSILIGYLVNKDTTEVRLPSRLVTICPSAFAACQELTSITLPDSVELVAGEAFYASGIRELVLNEGVSLGMSFVEKCERLKKITFPSALGEIGYRCFEGTPWLAAQPDGFVTLNTVSGKAVIAFKGEQNTDVLELPAGVTKIVAGGCEKSKIRSIRIREGVEIGAYAFEDCDLLEEVFLPNDIRSLPGYVFSSCEKLKSISLPSGLTEIKCGAFQYCKSLKGLNFQNVNRIEYDAFAGSGLESVELQDGCELGRNAFRNCESLSYIRLPSDLANVIDGLLGNCSSLTSVDIPKQVKSIGYGAFEGCSSLKSVSLPDGVKIIDGGAFRECSSLKSVYLPDGLETIDVGAFKNCVELIEIDLPKGVEVNSGAFNGCLGLTKLNLSGVTLVGSCFGNCANIEEIEADADCSLSKTSFENLKGLKRVKIESMEVLPASTFAGCSLLNEVEIGGLKEIGKYAFRNCLALTSFDFSKVSVLRGNAFDGSGLKTLELPENIALDGDVFNACKSLEEILLPKSLTQLPEGTFWGCNALKSINLEYVKSIGKLALAFCKSLKEVKLSKDLESLGESVFAGCEALETLVLPDGLKTAGKQQFRSCSALKEIVVPTGVVSSLEQILDRNESIERIYFRGSEEEWQKGLADGFALKEGVSVLFFEENEANIVGDKQRFWHFVLDLPVAWS